MAWVIHDEARGESLKGARAVLDAVLARVKQRNQTACQVVSDRKQFSGYKHGIFYTMRDPASEAILTRYKEVSKMSPVVENCPYFHATYVRPPWASKMQVCKQVGRHIFYKERKK